MYPCTMFVAVTELCNLHCSFVFLSSIHLCDELITACVSRAQDVSLLHGHIACTNVKANLSVM